MPACYLCHRTLELTGRDKRWFVAGSNHVHATCEEERLRRLQNGLCVLCGEECSGKTIDGFHAKCYHEGDYGGYGS